MIGSIRQSQTQRLCGIVSHQHIPREGSVHHFDTPVALKRCLEAEDRSDQVEFCIFDHLLRPLSDPPLIVLRVLPSLIGDLSFLSKYVSVISLFPRFPAFFLGLPPSPLYTVYEIDIASSEDVLGLR